MYRGKKNESRKSILFSYGTTRVSVDQAHKLLKYLLIDGKNKNMFYLIIRARI